MRKLPLLLIPFVFTSCASFNKKMDNWSKTLSESISDVISKPFNSSEESIQKTLKLANEKAFKKPITLRYSKFSRMPLKAGQSVTYLHEMSGANNHKEVIKFLVKKANKKEVTIEVHRWESRENLIPEFSGYRVGKFPTRPKFIYNENELSNLGYELIPHEFRTIDEGQFVKETYTKKEKNDIDSLNRMAMRGLMGHFFNRFKSAKTKATRTKCETKYIKSNRCYKYDGFYKSIIGVKEKETTLVHSNIPITGVVEAKGENYKMTLIAYSKRDKDYKLFK